MNQEQLHQFFTQRHAALEALKHLVSPNFFEYVHEKIAHEEEALLMILHGKVRTQEALSEYSFVLDERYFEQRLTSH